MARIRKGDLVTIIISVDHVAHRVKVKLSPRAQRDLDRTRGATWERVREALLALARTPRPKGCVKLSAGAWRVRIGNLRILYDIDDKAKMVEVLRIGHRRNIYRRV